MVDGPEASSFCMQKKGYPEFPVKMVGYWTRHSYQRGTKDSSMGVEKIIQTSSASMLDTEEQKGWHRKITKSHDTAVAGGIKGPFKFMKLGLSAQYNYHSSEEHSESFNSRVREVAMSTFKQTTTVNYDIDIPAYVPGEGTHMSVWFFKTTVIGQDLTSADQELFDKGFIKTGPCYDIPPNCLPGQCKQGDPDCFTCQPGAEPIDSDFEPPVYCSPCPLGFEHTFFESFKGECAQPENSGEYDNLGVLSVESCAKRCLADADCYAFDIQQVCYLNNRCDYQDTDTSYLSCKKSDGCPEGFELTFTGKPDGECQQSTENEGEYGKQTGQTMKQCGQRCYQDAECFAFDFKDGSCYLNKRCDSQDEGDGYTSCKKQGTISSDSESKIASIRSENDRLKHVNEALKKALEAMAN